MKKLKNLLIVLGSVLVLAACQNSYGDDDYYPSATTDSSKTATDNSEGSDSTSSSSGSSSDESSDSSSESTGDSSDSGNSSDSANTENGNSSSSSDSTSSGNSSESNGNSEADNSNGNSSSGSDSSSSSSSGDNSSSSGTESSDDISSGSSSSGSGDASNSGSSSGTGDSSGNGSSDFELPSQPSDFRTRNDFDVADFYIVISNDINETKNQGGYVDDVNNFILVNHFPCSRLNLSAELLSNQAKMFLGHWDGDKWVESAVEGFWRNEAALPKFSDESVYLSSILGSSSPLRNILKPGYYYLRVEYNGTERKSYFKTSLLETK